MLPNLTQDLEQQLKNMVSAANNQISPVKRSLKFDSKKNQFIFESGKAVEVNGNEALAQWIELNLRVYKDKYTIYQNEAFGANIEDLMGQKLSPFHKAELTREIRESLLKSPQILSISDIKLTINKGIILIDIELKTYENSLMKVVV